MAIQSALASQYWQPHQNAREMWEYGGDIYSLGIYRQGTEINALGMFRTNGVALGEPSLTNGGVTWEEVDIGGSPRKAWAMNFGQNPYNLININADRFGDVIYFACQCAHGPAQTIQVGSFNLATGLWGPQGADTLANPNTSTPNILYVADLKMVAAGSYLITYRDHYEPFIPPNVDRVLLVAYIAGAWVAALVVNVNDPLLSQGLSSWPRIAHEQGTDFAHLAWIQANGGGGPPPYDSAFELRVITYTIPTATFGAFTVIDTGFGTNPGFTIQRTLDQSYFHNFGGNSYMAYYWRYGTAANAYERRYAKVTPTNSAAPVWTTGLLFSTLYEYTTNWRFVTVAGTLLFVHAIGEDNLQVAPYVNVDPQIAYRAWSGAAWAAVETTYYKIATGSLWPGRVSNILAVPDSATAENYDPGGNPFGLHAIGTFNGHRGSGWQMPLVASSIGGTPGFVALVPGYWERLFGANAQATYFFREPSAAPPPVVVGNNVMFFGMVGL